MLGVSAAIIYKMTLIANTAKFMFPKVDCAQTEKNYANLQASHPS